MKTVDESIQHWCLTSVDFVRHHQPKSRARTTLLEPTLAAEQAIEAAAFLKLVESRGLRSLDITNDMDCGIDGNNELLRPLVDSCPLNATSTPEILGSIHELLVSRRDDSQTNSSRRVSKSRKVGGVFYTPQPVIDYIVRQTLGPRLEQSTPDQVLDLKILDPAAGCGAFLVAAFRYLMDWHLIWYTTHEPDLWPSDLVLTTRGWQLTYQRCHSILNNNLFGVDLDPAAIAVARRILWLALMDSSSTPGPPIPEDLDGNRFTSNLKQGHALIGAAFGENQTPGTFPDSSSPFDWTNAFPQIANLGGFEIVIGNPPYRRERNFKRELDDIGATPIGRYRSPRMDLWYYFVHRGIQLLRDGGTLSFITNAYWINGTGADKLIAALRDDVHLDELFLLQNQPVFAGVSGRHLIFRLTKSANDQATVIKIVPSEPVSFDQSYFGDATTIRTFTKTQSQLFRDGFLDVWPPSDRLLEKLRAFPRLIEFGVVRQGIAENPAAINRRTLERFHEDPSARDWNLGDGVFSLQAKEVQRLELAPHETQLLRPYHELCDLGRYWRATQPSRQLIYSTRHTCPEISELPALHQHLARFRVILEARRETRSGSNRWWHLHWPRDENIWRANKLVALQMAPRPSFVPTLEPTYVSFSANVFVRAKQTREDLRYFCGLLNSKILWAWFVHHAKHRGIGLELNGHILEQAPIRRIDFENVDDVRQHDELVSLVDHRIRLERSLVENGSSPGIPDGILASESQIDALVASLYRLDAADTELANHILSR